MTGRVAPPHLYFNPHSPCGERRFACHQIFKIIVHFNPHSPCGERQIDKSLKIGIINFNPHSPCGERQEIEKARDTMKNFNPHSPCGERLIVITQPNFIVVFQSTLPMRGATHAYGWRAHNHPISIHTPHAGSDTPKTVLSLKNIQISIHTPHAGSDGGDGEGKTSPFIFQSTLPMRGATSACRFPETPLTISIHTPHAGSDIIKKIN